MEPAALTEIVKNLLNHNTITDILSEIEKQARHNATTYKSHPNRGRVVAIADLVGKCNTDICELFGD